MNYSQDPNFGFTGSVMGGLPTTLDDINPQYYSQIKAFVDANGGRLASICGVRLYDTLRIDAGVIPLKDFVFFANGVGAQQGLFVANTQYVKQEIDVTPWVTQGQLSNGYEALIWSIQVYPHLAGSLDESVQTAGNAINLPLDPGIISGEAATDAIKQGNLLRAIQESFYFELFVNNTSFEHGNAALFPTCYGSSYSPALVGTVAAPGGDGMMNNGWGWSYQMPVMRHIPSLTRFGIRMKTQNPFTAANVGPFRLQVVLEGIGVQPVTG